MNNYRSAGSISRGAFLVSVLICLSMFTTPVFAQYIGLQSGGSGSK